MSSPSPARPDLTSQTGLRTTFRVVGAILLVVALVFLGMGLADFFGSMNDSDAPHRFWMVFVGVPLLGVAGWCLQAGFLGAGARFVAGETAPVLKDTANYLTDGRGVLGIGADARDEASPAAGDRFCPKCGAAHAEGAQFCSSCGDRLG